MAAAEAAAIGFGGVTSVAQASGLSGGTVIRGIAELKTAPKPARGQRIRREGAGRKRTVDHDATLKREDLEFLVEPVTRGHLETPLRWTCKSVRQLAAELQRMGHPAASDGLQPAGPSENFGSLPRMRSFTSSATRSGDFKLTVSQ